MMLLSITPILEVMLTHLPENREPVLKALFEKVGNVKN